MYPAAFHEPLVWDLTTCCLGQRPAYDALSYAWGGLGERKSITLNSAPWEVTANLEQALLHLRLENENVVLWVDAACP
jgi:hypothetical protein